MSVATISIVASILSVIISLVLISVVPYKESDESKQDLLVLVCGAACFGTSGWMIYATWAVWSWWATTLTTALGVFIALVAILNTVAAVYGSD